jgi:hypothetical protein
MNRHTEMRQLLYPYLQKELTPDEVQQVEDHVAACKECAMELTATQSALDVLPRSVKSASEERTEAFWDQFPMDVVRRIQGEDVPGKAHGSSFWEAIELLLVSRWKVLAPVGVALVVVGLFLLFRQPQQPLEVAHEQPVLTGQPVQVERAAERAAQYFQKSKTLLVGISNMRTVEGQPVDLTSERRVSRELVHEARYLRQQPLDVRSTQLIGDLERILIELANMEKEADLPNVEMIRSGIHRENLLFKIRMAQPLYDSTRIAIKQTSY